MQLLVDQNARNRFSSEIETNFSVIAPAGVGKTTAIVERILKIAHHDLATGSSLLESCIIVTYTQKAARELQERTRQKIFSQKLPSSILQSFHKAFFGTIHSLCHHFISEFSRELHLPTSFTLLENESALWLKFIRQYQAPHSYLKGYLDINSLYDIAHTFKLSDSNDSPISDSNLSPARRHDLLKYVHCDHFKPIFDFPEKSRAADSIREQKHLLQDWLKRQSSRKTSPIDTSSIGTPLSQDSKSFSEKEDLSESFFDPIPDCSKGGQAFIELWHETLAPLKNHLARVALELTRKIAIDYRQFRIQKGLIRYDDMIFLARNLFENETIAQILSDRKYAIILDEAQDTDSEQFDFLLKLCSPLQKLPLPGYFSMVGDPQQSIFSSRADLPFYLKLHAKLISSKIADSLTFCTTMRCAEDIVNIVNTTFPRVLCPEKFKQQVHFVPLKAKPDAPSGQVLKLIFKTKDFSPNLSHETSLDTFSNLDSSADAVTHLNQSKNSAFSLDSNSTSNPNSDSNNAHQLALWLKYRAFQALKISNWHDIAILCPRNSWISILASALQKEAIPFQVHSQNTILGDNPTYAWITALLTIATQPENAFEITGVLREIFGHSDRDIAYFVQDSNSKKDAFKTEFAEISVPHSIDIAHPIQILKPTITDLGRDKKAKIDSQENRNGINCVSHTLNTLYNIRLETQKYPLRTAVESWIQKTKLIERLLLLPDIEHPVIFETRDEVLTQATKAEKERLLLSEFAQSLQLNLSQSSADQTPKPNHIQLYSYHKSKGLEWPMVILPFFFKPVRFPHPTYPHMLQLERQSPPQLILDKYQKSEQLRDQEDQYRQAELERLLYVATTRAKDTLIFIDDASFFSDSQHSMADFFQALPHQVNRSLWESLPFESPDLLESTSLHDREATRHTSGIDFQDFAENRVMDSSGERIMDSDRSPPFEFGLYKKALDNAESFRKSLTPSTLTQNKYISKKASPKNLIDKDRLQKKPFLLENKYNSEDSIKLEEQKNDQVMALKSKTALCSGLSLEYLDYGNAWHRLLQNFPFQNPFAWSHHWNTSRILFPEGLLQRAQTEWQKFLCSDLIYDLSKPHLIIRTEVPFIYHEASHYIEGFIDVLVFDPEKNHSLIIDWKTDDIPIDQIDSLKTSYGPQMNTYLKVIQSILTAPTSAMIYATKCAKCLTF